AGRRGCVVPRECPYGLVVIAHVARLRYSVQYFECSFGSAMRQWLESRRYQKSAVLESDRTRMTGRVDRRANRWSPALALITVACSSVDAQQGHSTSAAGNQAARTSIHIPAVKLAGLPPTPQTPAFQAVLAAREANDRKQWSVLGMAVPQARGDVLGDYPQF